MHVTTSLFKDDLTKKKGLCRLLLNNLHYQFSMDGFSTVSLFMMLFALSLFFKNSASSFVTYFYFDSLSRPCLEDAWYTPLPVTL